VLDSGRLDVLKLNLDELAALTKLNTPAAAARHLLAGPAARLRRPGAVVAVTDGPRPALLFQAGPNPNPNLYPDLYPDPDPDPNPNPSAGLFQADRAWRLSVPTVEPVINAIGAGDVCTGIFAHHLGRGDEPVDAFAWGLAAPTVTPTLTLALTLALALTRWGLAAACARVSRQLPGFEAAKVRESCGSRP
jgi:sugar/nucleoside kinase (ribokinase family)